MALLAHRRVFRSEMCIKLPLLGKQAVASGLSAMGNLLRPKLARVHKPPWHTAGILNQLLATCEPVGSE